jgi:predicted RND superfamily exporter protein
MVYTPQTVYRSQSCKDLAERVERGAAYESLNVTVNIDTILPNRDSGVINQVQQAIEENTNFVLFSDKDHYIIIIPCKLAVACYVDGKQETMEVLKDIQQFQNRIKIAFAVYDKFHRVDRFIESRNHGNGALPGNTDRKDLLNGKERTGESEAGV